MSVEEAPAVSSPAPQSPKQVMATCAAVTVAMTVVIAFAFDPDRAGSIWMIGSLGALYVVLASIALVRLKRLGELGDSLRLARGDIWLGGMVAGLLYGGGMAGHLFLTPHRSPREAWIMLLYLQLGDPRGEGRALVAGAVFVLAALEEIIWRGWIMRSLRDVMSDARALGLSSALFALAHVPTMFLLGHPAAGPNPLIVMAALGCSLVWGAVVLRTGRLIPAVIAHALFSWAIVEFPIWRP